jgi:AP-2 complex subunit alpha
MSTSKFRGLNVFIQDIRAAQNDAEKERKRVDKEMANIRQKFTSSKGLDSYNRKKYVWKMIFMFMMGYEVDFGHMEIINCLSAQKYSEKHVGYVGISLLLKNTDEMMTLVINSIQQDLKERERDEVQCLALAGIANIGGQMLTDAVGSSVLRLLTTGNTPAVVRKKAALTLLRLYRIDQTVIDVEETAPRLSLLVEARDLGVVTCVASLILSLCAKEKGGSRFQHLTNVVAPCILRLAQLVLHRMSFAPVG